MFSHNHYVPVLKSRQSEGLALRQLKANSRINMTPLFEVQSPALVKRDQWKYISRGWSPGKALFLDIDHGFRQQDPNYAAELLGSFLGRSSQDGYLAIPVTGLGRPESYQDIVKVAVNSYGNGLCIRLDADDWSHPAQLATKLKSAVGTFEVPRGQVDIVIDFKAFDHSQVGTLVGHATTIINGLPNLQDWRSLTIASTSFPLSPTYCKSHSPQIELSQIPRSDWHVWKSLIMGNQLGRLPAFGDYTIVHPDFGTMGITYGVSAKVKYATDDEWIVLRWHKGARQNEKFRDICQTLIAEYPYYGSTFSWGDEMISQVAVGKAGCGNAGEWVRIGINHPLSLAANQASTLASP